MSQSAPAAPCPVPLFFLTGFLGVNLLATIAHALLPVDSPTTSWLPLTLAILWSLFAIAAVWLMAARLRPLLVRARACGDAMTSLADGNLMPDAPGSSSPAFGRYRHHAIAEKNAVDTIDAYARQCQTHAESSSGLAVSAKAETAAIDDQARGLTRDMTDIAADAGETADKILGIAASVEQMHQASDDIARSMEKARQASERAATAARDNAVRIETLGGRAAGGVTGLRQVSTAVNDVRDRTVSLKTDMDALGRDSQAIGAILGVIADIADQTNLLALNAAIEAARAGDSGRGFAVVADEVRKLAEKTMAATRDVGQSIAGIQSMAQNNVAATEQAVTAVEDSLRLADAQIAATEGLMGEMRDTSREVGAITGIVDELRDLVFAASSASEEHSQATAEVAVHLSDTTRLADAMRERAGDGLAATRAIAERTATVAGTIGSMAASALQVHSATRELTHLSAGLTKQISGLRCGTPPFDIAAVKTAHLAWRARLESVIQGHEQLETGKVADHHQCVFGQWYDGQGSAGLGRLPVFGEIGKHHERVHALARDIVALANQGRSAEAKGLMEEFEATRGRLFAALDRMYLENTR